VQSGIILRIGLDLGNGDVPGCPYEFLELPVRHGIAVHPEAIHRDAMRRRLFRIVAIRSHAECAAGNPDHAGVLPGGIVDIDLDRGCRKRRRHFERCLPIDCQKMQLGREHATGGSFSWDIGPWSNIEFARLRYCGKMRWIAVIQMQGSRG
jgi:hypothetical protein